MKCKLTSMGCGGCQALEQPYAEQLQDKQQSIQQLLGRFGPVSPIVGAASPLHYRCKVTASFAADRSGRLLSGLYAQGTHRVLQGGPCLLEDEAASRAAAAVRQCAAACHYAPYDEDRGVGLLRHVLVRRGAATGQLMVVLVTAQPLLPGAKAFVSRLRQLCPQITTIVQNINQKDSSAVLGSRCKTLWGPGFIEDELCGCRFLLSPTSFYQVNPAQTEKLYQLAMQAAHLQPGCSVLDAYCGTGTIGLIAAHCGAGQVLGVESNRSAVQDAIRNARRNGIRNARFVAEDAGRFLQRMAADPTAAAPDVVFMDPPRAGSTPAFLRSLVQLEPKRIVYISCSPQTQARDLQQLTREAYRVESIQPVDLFPYTAHTECIVALTKR